MSDILSIFSIEKVGREIKMVAFRSARENLPDYTASNLKIWHCSTQQLWGPPYLADLKIHNEFDDNEGSELTRRSLYLVRKIACLLELGLWYEVRMSLIHVYTLKGGQNIRLCLDIKLYMKI
jgi:hypothetical protein